jgi:DNA-binding LacI/PurR family transcriptional regulator
MKDNTRSKAEQLKEILLERIRQGVYPVGSKMPSIRELVKSEKMCKATVAQVLNSLNESRYIKLENRRAAKVLRCPAKYRIGLFYMISAMRNSYFWDEFFRGIRDEIRNNPGFELVEFFNPRYGRSFYPAEVDGTLVMGSNDVKALASDGSEITGHPMVYVYNCPDTGEFCGVTSDFSQAMQEYIRQMHLQGCRKIAYVRLKADNRASNNKLYWFRHTARKYNIETVEININFMSHYCEEIGSECKRLFSEKECIDGIILSTDHFAQPVLRAAYECGKKIPEDIKLAGVDNLSDSAFMTPALTSLEIDRYQQGKTAVKMMIRRILDPGAALEQRLFPAHPVYRESLKEKTDN